MAKYRIVRVTQGSAEHFEVLQWTPPQQGRDGQEPGFWAPERTAAPKYFSLERAREHLESLRPEAKTVVLEVEF